MPTVSAKSLGVEPRGRLIPAPQARVHFRRGFDAVANALRSTLGPAGRTVLIERLDRNDAPEVLDDAALIAQRIVELPLHENAGAMLMRHLAWRVTDQVGDGAATAAVLAQALLREASRQMAAGAHPASLRKGIERGLEQALAALDRQALPMEGLALLRAVALAAGADDAVADKLVAIHERHGLDIVIALQESFANGLTVEVADGSKWDAGFASPAFVNDPGRNLAWGEEPLLLLTNIILDRAEQVIPLMERVAAAGERELVFIAPRFSDAALSVMLATNERGALHSLAITAPGLGDHRTGVLQDLAAQTGARYFSEAAGAAVERAAVGDLGRCGIVWASRDFFSVVDGEGDAAAIAARVRLIRGALERETEPSEREQLRLRLGRLTGGVALLGVGAATKSEMLERKRRAERAVKAIEAARREGVVPGGGVALLVAAQAVDARCPELSFDERLGRRALARALEEPLRAIVANAGGDPGAVVRVVLPGGGQLGYDALGRRVVDVRAAGILDPISVVRTALRDGVSAGVMALTTDAIVIPKYRLLHAPPHP